MVKDNLHERMRSFFDRIHDHEINENEAIELAWAHKDADEAWSVRYVSDLDQAARMAVALGPHYDILMRVAERTETGMRCVVPYPPLAFWRNRERRPGDFYPPPGLTFGCYSRWACGTCSEFAQHFSNGDGTCEAVTFTSAFRPYKPVSYRRTRPWLPLAPNDRQGARD